MHTSCILNHMTIIQWLLCALPFPYYVYYLWLQDNLNILCSYAQVIFVALTLPLNYLQCCNICAATYVVVQPACILFDVYCVLVPPMVMKETPPSFTTPKQLVEAITISWMVCVNLINQS